MEARRNRRHIIVPREPTSEKYQPHGRKIPEPTVPVPASRPAHGMALRQSMERAVDEASQRREAAAVEVHGAVPGLYVDFESHPGVSLELKTLEDPRLGIELVAVSEMKTGDKPPKTIQRATVVIPEGRVGHFIKRFEAYSKTTPKKKREHRHEKMLDPVARLRLATLRSLWTDSPEAYPGDGESIWWEVWLRRHDDRELERLMELAAAQDMDVVHRRLQFDDRIVVLVKATSEQLAVSVDVLNDLAEVQRAKETAAVFDDMGPEEQAEWAAELLQRVRGPAGDAPAACLLDTGINRGHPLLEAAAAPEDCSSVDPAWGPQDDGGGPEARGHGTQMAGLALYGDLAPLLAGAAPVTLRHRLESVKILPPRGANRPELYGAITAEAASRVEVQAPDRRRCFNLAVASTDDRDRGQPTSWSAAVDALAAGRVFDPSTQGLIYLDGEETPRRLFVVSAGNVHPAGLAVDHLARSETEPVHDPAHAWNALTVGAFTGRIAIHDPTWRGWQPVAAAGDLSPWSTTSVVFDKQWPLKPDVVVEGGNVAHNGAGDVDFPVPDLSLLSTHYRPAERSFVVSHGTSAASAQVSRMAAIVNAQYPSLWPETIRGLIVHSADWTQAMRAHFHRAPGKKGRERLVRRYGFGVPSLARALRSANDALTLIVQGSIRPFAPGANNRTRNLGDIHFHDLPWPRDVLQSLGQQSVRLRVTLSYFVEPNPGRRGWGKRHRYASHGLRFDVKGPSESFAEFRKRLNKAALDEDERKPRRDGSANEWYLGEQTRSRGSIHSDMLSGTAADLAERGVVGIYPVSGWWKDQPRRDRSHLGARYALIVSLETDAADVDIWTPVATEVGIPVATEVEV